MITYRRVGLNSSGAVSSPLNKLPMESLPPGAVLTRLVKYRSSQQCICAVKIDAPGGFDCRSEINSRMLFDGFYRYILRDFWRCYGLWEKGIRACEARNDELLTVPFLGGAEARASSSSWKSPPKISVWGPPGTVLTRRVGLNASDAGVLYIKLFVTRGRVVHEPTAGEDVADSVDGSDSDNGEENVPMVA